MAETQKMWSRRDNRSNKRTDLAYCIAWSKHGLRPVKSRNWPLKNSSTEARSISASEMRCTVGRDFHLRALEGYRPAAMASHCRKWAIVRAIRGRKGDSSKDKFIATSLLISEKCIQLPKRSAAPQVMN